MMPSSVAALFAISLLCVHCNADDFNYAALIDAGTTGSRMHVYRWKKQVNASHGVPSVNEIKNLKKKPGISTLADNPEKVASHLKPLVNLARDSVPSDRHEDTPIYLMATAGVRLLPRLKRSRLFEKIHAFFENPTMSPFSYSRANSHVLSGEEEGVFSWVAVNYNLGFFTNASVTKSVGLLEMGGASVQVAFIPNGQILAEKFPLKVGKTHYSLYVHSYLHFGGEYTEKKIRQHLHDNQPSESVLYNPCMLKGDSISDSIRGDVVTFHGSSNYTACDAITRSFMWKVSDDRCHPSPCTIGNTYQPYLDSSSFFAIKAFVYTPAVLGILDETKVLDTAALRNAGRSYCSKNLSEAVDMIGEGLSKYASVYCLMSSYIPTLLHSGLGFNETQNHLTATNDIEGKNTDWPLGAVLYDIGRRCDWAVFNPEPALKPVISGGCSVYKPYPLHRVFILLASLLLLCLKLY